MTAVRFTRPVEAQEPRPTHGDIIHIHVPPPTPTPRPVVHHVVSQPKSHTQQHVALVKTTSPNKGGDKSTVANPQPTGGTDAIGTGTDTSPAPTATPQPHCSAPYVPASVTNAMPAESPEEADGATGQARVKVDLSAAGAVLGVSIYTSTGNPLLDRAAMRAARASTYKAETRDCEPVSGSYLFNVDFQN